MTRMRRPSFLPPPRRNREHTESGFSLIEVMVALGLLVMVMMTTTGFFVTSLKQSNGQTQAQEATVLADAMLDYTRNVPIDAVLSGRTASAVGAAIANPPAGLDLSQDVQASGNYDTATPPASTVSIPLSMISVVNGTRYTVYAYIDRCYLTAAKNADCKSPVTTFGWVYRISVDVT